MAAVVSGILGGLDAVNGAISTGKVYQQPKEDYPTSKSDPTKCNPRYCPNKSEYSKFRF